MTIRTQTAMKILTRWLIRRDLQTVLDIDRDSFWEPWGEDAFLEKLRQRNCIGMVAVQGEKKNEKIVGFMVYELWKEKLVLLRLAVHPEHRRQGVGRAMLDRLVAKLSLQRRHEAWFEVPEENLAAQLWLRACGWRCQATVESAACEGNFYWFAKGVEL